MQENQKKDEHKDTAVNLKKDGQQAAAAKWKNKLFGIIVLLILGFAANYFIGDGGQETGQNNYPTQGVSITPELTLQAQSTPEISEKLTEADDSKQLEAKDEFSDKDIEAEDGDKDKFSDRDTETEDDDKDKFSDRDTEAEDNDKDTLSEKEDSNEADKEDDRKTDTESSLGQDNTDEIEILYEFRRASYLEQHFEKHGAEFEYETKEEYLAGANRVIQSPDVLHKIEAEDGDDIYYLEETNEFVVVSTDGYIRTYFRPSAGINYYNRQ